MASVNENTSIPRYLARKRTGWGLSEDQAATEIGITTKQLKGIEAAALDPRWSVVRKILVWVEKRSEGSPDLGEPIKEPLT